jgi:hypothetical protein
MVMYKRFTLLALLGILVICGGCALDDVVQPEAEQVAVDEAGRKAQDSTGNNLSFPVVWSDGYALGLRGSPGEELWGGVFTEVDGVAWYHQQDALNQWQAESADGSAAPVIVDVIDWGDNLEARGWPDRSKVRVEVALFLNLDVPMTGYTMGYISGLGIDEMWGASGATYDATQAIVYSHNARLTIQKLPEDTTEFVWDEELGRWFRQDGVPMGEPFYNSGVWEGDEGPFGSYSAEINVKGKVIYGMQWDLKQAGDGPGTYRLTFSLDSLHGTVANNTGFDEETIIFVTEEEEEALVIGVNDEPVGGVSAIVPELNLTYIDVPITPGGGGKGRDKDETPGQGGGGGGGGGGHGGPH